MDHRVVGCRSPRSLRAISRASRASRSASANRLRSDCTLREVEQQERDHGMVVAGRRAGVRQCLPEERLGLEIGASMVQSVRRD